MMLFADTVLRPALLLSCFVYSCPNLRPVNLNHVPASPPSLVYPHEHVSASLIWWSVLHSQGKQGKQGKQGSRTAGPLFSSLILRLGGASRSAPPSMCGTYAAGFLFFSPMSTIINRAAA